MCLRINRVSMGIPSPKTVRAIWVPRWADPVQEFEPGDHPPPKRPEDTNMQAKKTEKAQSRNDPVVKPFNGNEMRLQRASIASSLRSDIAPAVGPVAYRCSSSLNRCLCKHYNVFKNWLNLSLDWLIATSSTTGYL